MAGSAAIFFLRQADSSGMQHPATGLLAPGILFRILALGTMIVLSGCVQQTGTGTLTGNVSIGPLCPVEPCNVSPDRLAAAYAAWPITISLPDGNVVTTVVADPVTGYSVPLPPGTYVVDIPHQGVGGSRDLPKTVIIRSGETVRLDISVDTGIR